MLRFETAGESHGECLVATLTGLPAGIPISLDAINHELWRRQQGYGRGGRMKIETDRAEIVSGVRHSQTIGSPIAMIIRNADWKNWTEALPVEDIDGAEDKRKPVTRPRPGHADLAGSIKYNFQDARYILERASARETTARVAVGALAKTFLAQFEIGILSHVIAIGGVHVEREVHWQELEELSKKQDVTLGCVDAAIEHEMKDVRRSRVQNRRHGRRRFRSGGAQRAARPRIAHHLGLAIGRSAGPGRGFHSSREGRRNRARRRGRGLLSDRKSRTQFSTIVSNGNSRAAPIAPVGWKVG